MSLKRQQWIALEKARHASKSEEQLKAEHRKLLGPAKLVLMFMFLSTIWDQRVLSNLFLVRVGTHLISLDPVFTTGAVVVALVAALEKRELLGFAVGAVGSLAYCAGRWTLADTEYTLGQLIDWSTLHLWLFTLYLLIISAVTQSIRYVRLRLRPVALTPEPERQEDRGDPA